ncbi:hypothetical protein ACEV8V_22640 [Vibrio parahaemolyticus]|uniref:hypothetical protein n=1 Tax=Vibrio parahaemolyticus TaxID=670 RepID=UPI00111DA139|nr:hypothetical protein [Vibrio parahaemolyticus]MBE3803215.1 hypothetical protein [Vibrio parahaemolyticus]MBE3830605.1 hypothetical protein [Vibrio parahaemolyticus]MBE3986264.1 hypothetical protein [Vibrio parahaemolyticus]TOG16327.1 hypothetical protein CGJ06_24095 [Vibrio parahaemolyticus]TOJ42152.1 hypothetical protein CGI38_23555 [Vibrio parahaemolyticus]
MEKSITLNLSFELIQQNAERIMEIYSGLDGWLSDSQYPAWYGQYGDENYIVVSSEPSGLVVTGNVDNQLWLGWVTVLCSKLTLAVGQPIHDAEM